MLPRTVLNGALWVLRSDSPWCDLPERCGPWHSNCHHFNAWRRSKVFKEILEALQTRLDAEGRIDWDSGAWTARPYEPHERPPGPGSRGPR